MFGSRHLITFGIGLLFVIVVEIDCVIFYYFSYACMICIACIRYGPTGTCSWYDLIDMFDELV